jgi:hypothetical protein
MAVFGYEIRIKKEGEEYGPWEDVGDITQYQLTGLEPDTTYYVQVRAYCASGNDSNPSNEYIITTPDDPDIPLEGLRPFFAITTAHDGGNPGRINGWDLSGTSPLQRHHLQDNDIVVVQLITQDEAISIVPSGWTEAPDSPISVTSTLRQYTFWKRITAQEPDIVFTSTTGIQGGRAVAIRNCIETGDPWVDTVSMSGTGTTITLGALTNDLIGTLGVFLWCQAGSSTLPTAYNFTNSTFDDLRKLNEGVYGSLLKCVFGVGTTNAIGDLGITTHTSVVSEPWVSWAGLLRGAENERPHVVGSNIAGIYNEINSAGGYAFWPLYEIGDYLFAYAETNNQAVTISTTDGWTEAPSSPVINAGIAPTRLTVAYKKIIGDEDVFPILEASHDHIRSCSILVRGAVATGNPFNISASDAGGVGTAVTAIGATTTVNNCLVLVAVATSNDATSSTNFSAWANADLSSVTEVSDGSTSTGAGGGIGLASGGKATAGTYGSTTATQVGNVEYATWTGAIAPNGGSIPTVVSANQNNESPGFYADPFLTVTPQANDIWIVFAESLEEVLFQFPNTFDWQPMPNLPITNAGTNPTTLSGYWRRCSGKRLDVPFTGTYDHIVGHMQTIKGIATTDIFDFTNSATGLGTSVSIPGGATTTGKNIFLCAVATTRDASTNNTQWRSWTNVDVSSLCAMSDFTVTTGTGGGVGSSAGYKELAGTIGNTTVTQSTSSEWAAWTCALKPKEA